MNKPIPCSEIACSYDDSLVDNMIFKVHDRLITQSLYVKNNLCPEFLGRFQAESILINAHDNHPGISGTSHL